MIDFKILADYTLTILNLPNPRLNYELYLFNNDEEIIGFVYHNDQTDTSDNRIINLVFTKQKIILEYRKNGTDRIIDTFISYDQISVFSLAIFDEEKKCCLKLVVNGIGLITFNLERTRKITEKFEKIVELLS